MNQNITELDNKKDSLRIKTIFLNFLNKSIQLNSEIDFSTLWKDFSSLHGYSELDIDLDALQTIFENVYNLGYIDYLFLKDFEEIIIHSNKNIQFFGEGEERIVINSIEEDDYIMSLNILCSRNKINWNVKNPFVSFGYKRICNHQEERFRITLIHSNLTQNNLPKVFIRKIALSPFLLKDYIETEYTQALLDLIINKSNIIVAGSTGSGKTSLMKAMLNNTKISDHLIVLEDTQEIVLPNHENVSHLLSQERENYSLENFCSYALRMRPDRLVIGELRSKEIVPFFLTMNNGHKGLISSIHANSPKNTVERLALLFKIYCTQDMDYLTITSLICQNIDYIIYVENKKITNISKLLGHENGTPFLDNIYSLN